MFLYPVDVRMCVVPVRNEYVICELEVQPVNCFAPILRPTARNL